MALLKTFTRDWYQCTILCRSNNITAVTYLNQKGWVYSNLLCHLALKIWDWYLNCYILLNSRTPPRAGQFNSRSQVQEKLQPDQLKAQFISVSSFRATDGSGPVCITSHNTPAMLLQFAPRFRCGNARYLHTELDSIQGVCQPSLVPQLQVSRTISSTEGQNSADKSLWWTT